MSRYVYLHTHIYKLQHTATRCNTHSGGAAGMVGDALNAKLSEHVRSTNNLFKDQVISDCI